MGARSTRAVCNVAENVKADVYKSTLYKAAFKSDPGTSGRTKAAWLRHATPMETEPRAKRTGSAHGSQPPSPRSAEKGAKKPRGSTRALMI